MPKPTAKNVTPTTAMFCRAAERANSEKTPLVSTSNTPASSLFLINSKQPANINSAPINILVFYEEICGTPNSAEGVPLKTILEIDNLSQMLSTSKIHYSTNSPWNKFRRNVELPVLSQYTGECIPAYSKCRSKLLQINAKATVGAKKERPNHLAFFDRTPKRDTAGATCDGRTFLFEFTICVNYLNISLGERRSTCHTYSASFNAHADRTQQGHRARIQICFLAPRGLFGSSCYLAIHHSFR